MDSAAVFRHGKSLLNEALSPSSKELLQDYFTADDEVLDGGNNSAHHSSTAAVHGSGEGGHTDDADDDKLDRTSSRRSSTQYELPEDPLDIHVVAKHSTSCALSPPRAIVGQNDHTDPSLAPGARVHKLLSSRIDLHGTTSASYSKSYVQIQCDKRPFCLQLSMNARDEIVVAGFTRDLANGGTKGAVERSRKVHVNDVLIAVNDEMDALTSPDATAQVMIHAEMPAVLTFRRVPVTRSTLGEYTRDEIVRNLRLLEQHQLVDTYGVEDAASMVKASIDVLDERRSSTSLMHFVDRVSQFLCSFPPKSTAAAEQRREELVVWMDKVHRYVDKKKKEQLKKWSTAKSSNYRRIEVLGKQRDNIAKKLEKMRASPEELHPENHLVWQEFIELRHLVSQLDRSVEKAKQEHYLPDFEAYALRFGSEGVYVGLGDLWISQFQARFTVETRSSAPHVYFHLSTPSTTGLKLRATNVKLSTEGRLPSFQCDELNIEAQLVADIPFVFDSLSGWSVPQDDLHVKLKSFSYYERRDNSVKRGADHDTVIKLFINRLLPSVVRRAAQNLFCVELGPLFESRNAQLVMTGEMKIEGRPLGLYDAPLNTPRTGATSPTYTAEHTMSEEARLLLALSEEEGDALGHIFKSVETSFKKRGYITSEHSNVSIRVLTYYFDQFKAFPNVKVLITELWNQSLQLLMGVRELDVRAFEALVTCLEHLQQYPVDVSVTFSEVTFRLDLCEAAAVYYTTLQRIIRHKMDSIAVGLANIDAMKNGSFLESELSSLDDWYDKVNRILSYVTINVDDLGVMFRGGVPAGFTSNILLEANDLACKGPCTGSVTIPLTDLATLQVPSSHQVVDSFTALLHERNALAFSKFFLNSNADNQSSSDVDEDGHVTALPSDRVSVSVRNTAARVLFEVPTDPTVLTPGSTFVPFAFTLVTDDDEIPKIRFETGEHAKCQYKAEQIKIKGGLWHILERTKDAATATIETAMENQPVIPSTADATSESVWTEYLDSSFFSLKFHFFTSCQVTRDHIYWSLKSASLSHPKIAQLRHRISLVELLQDIGMISLVDNAQAQQKSRRRQDARVRRALYRKLGVTGLEDMGGGVDLSALSLQDFSRGSFPEAAGADLDRLSDSESEGYVSDYLDGHSENNGSSANENEISEQELDKELSKAIHATQPDAPKAKSPLPPLAHVEKQSSVFF